MTLLDEKRRRSKSGNVVVTRVYGKKPRPIHHHHHHRSGCFPAGTRIQTPSGFRVIENLEPGDSVLSFEGSIKSVQPVLQCQKFLRHRIFEIFLSNRLEPVRTTSSHTFSTTRGWIRTTELSSGDLVHFVESGVAGTVAVQQVSPTNQHADVYNLITASAHTFVADGLIAHNFTKFRVARTLLHKYVLDPVRLMYLEPHRPKPV